MARYDDDDDRGGRYGSAYAGRASWSEHGGRYGGRERGWDDEDDSRSPGGRSLTGQRFEEFDEELGGARRGFSAMDSDERDSWAGGPGYQESHGPSSRSYDRERPYGRSPGGARYDDDDNRGRDRYSNERGERGWGSERSRREDDDVERGSYGSYGRASSRSDFDRGGSSDRWSGGERWSSGARSSSRDRSSGGGFSSGRDRSWGSERTSDRERSRDWDQDDDDRRGWILEGGSRRDEGGSRRDDDRRSDGRRGFAAMDPERRRELASRGGRASHGGGRERSWDDDRARGRSSQGSRYEDEQRGESRRGFAAMDPRRQREISRMGGRASHQRDRDR